jgi:hypothetical protein
VVVGGNIFPVFIFPPPPPPPFVPLKTQKYTSKPLLPSKQVLSLVSARFSAAAAAGVEDSGGSSRSSSRSGWAAGKENIYIGKY